MSSRFRPHVFEPEREADRSRSVDQRRLVSDGERSNQPSFVDERDGRVVLRRDRQCLRWPPYHDAIPGPTRPPADAHGAGLAVEMPVEVRRGDVVERRYLVRPDDLTRVGRGVPFVFEGSAGTVPSSQFEAEPDRVGVGTDRRR